MKNRGMTLLLIWLPLFAGAAQSSSTYDETLKREISANLIKGELEAKSLKALGVGGIGCDAAATDDGFWLGLAKTVIQYESGGDPRKKFDEPPPLNKPSLGLFQLSVGDQCRDGTWVQSVSQAFDPTENIRCATKIMKNLVQASNGELVGTQGSWQGLAKYWSVLRKPEIRKKIFQNACAMAKGGNGKTDFTAPESNYRQAPEYRQEVERGEYTRVVDPGYAPLPTKLNNAGEPVVVKKTVPVKPPPKLKPKPKYQEAKPKAQQRVR